MAEKADRVTRTKSEWYERNRSKISEEAKAFRRDSPDEARRLKAEHYKRRAEHVKARIKKYKDKVKLDVLTHYSHGEPKCAACGVTDVACLNLDHVNNDGLSHRKEIGHRGGNGFYLWVVKNNFPPMFQVLCMNCNMLKHLGTPIRSTTPSDMKLKVDVMVFYGNGVAACTICGNNRIDILTIDHMDGSGNKHRKELGLKGGRAFHRWLRKNKFPERFMTLCFNCNFRKGRRANGNETGQSAANETRKDHE